MYPGIAVVSLWCVGGRGGERGKGELREREREREREKEREREREREEGNGVDWRAIEKDRGGGKRDLDT